MSALKLESGPDGKGSTIMTASPRLITHSVSRIVWSASGTAVIVNCGNNHTAEINQ